MLLQLSQNGISIYLSHSLAKASCHLFSHDIVAKHGIRVEILLHLCNRSLRMGQVLLVFIVWNVELMCLIVIRLLSDNDENCCVKSRTLQNYFNLRTCFRSADFTLVILLP